MEQFNSPETMEIEHIGDVYLISFTFKDSPIVSLEAKFVCGNIFINEKVKMGFDAPETFETYFDCNIEKVDFDFGTGPDKDSVYLDIYVRV